MRIRLSDADRERIGGPEWLEVDRDRLSVAEAQKLEGAGVAWQDYRSGGGPMSVLALVWIGLLRAGVSPPAAAVDLDINLAGFQIDADPSPGKARSARSSASTRSTSATRRTGTSSRKTSKS